MRTSRSFLSHLRARVAFLLANERGEAAMDLLVPGGGSRLKALRLKATKVQNRIDELYQLLESRPEPATFTDEERAELKTLAQSKRDLGEAIAEAEAAADREREMPALSAPVEQKAAATGLQLVKPTGFESFGKQLQAIVQASKPGGRIDSRLEFQAAASGLNEAVGSEGGFLVDQEKVKTIRERVYETGQLISRVNRQPIGDGFNGVKLFAVDETSRANGSRYGGIQAYWTAEAGLKQPSKPAFREIDLKLKKVAALVYVTDELLQDSVALEAWITRHLPDELRFKVEDAIINGTGAGQPLGFLNSGAAVTVTRNTAGAIKWEDVVAMWGRMWAPSRNNAVWLVDQSAEAQLYSMTLSVGVGGVPVFMPAGGASQMPFSTLFGRPIIPYEYGAALGTTGDIALVDPTQYTLIEKGGVQTASSIHVRFIYDETVFRFVYRVDGMPDWNSALTPKSGGSTLSPFILLS